MLPFFFHFWITLLYIQNWCFCLFLWRQLLKKFVANKLFLIKFEKLKFLLHQISFYKCLTRTCTWRTWTIKSKGNARYAVPAITFVYMENAKIDQCVHIALRCPTFWISMIHVMKSKRSKMAQSGFPTVPQLLLPLVDLILLVN